MDSLSWYPVNYSFPGEEQSFLEDRHHDKWFITARSLYRYSTATGSFSMILPGKGDRMMPGIRKVNCITADSSRTIWIGTEGAGLVRWDDVAGRPEAVNLCQAGCNSGEYRNVTSLLFDKGSILWAFGPGTFTRLDPENHGTLNYKFLYRNQTVYENPGSPVEVNQSFRFSDGSIWFFSRMAGLIFRFDQGSGKLSLYRTPNFVVFQCIADRNESLWFACVRNNVFRMVIKPVPYFTISPVNNTADVAQTHKGSIIEDRQGRTWFLFNRGISVADGFEVTSSVRFNPVTLPGGETTVSGGFTDSKGYLWFASKKGRILRYDPSSDSQADFTPPGFPHDIREARVPMIREDGPGTIWMATSHHGLCRLVPGSSRFEQVLDFSHRSVTREMNQVLDFTIGSQGDLWILTSDQILSVRVPELRVTDHLGSGDASLKALGANIRVREDKNGNIWILNLLSGLNRFNRADGSFSRVSIGGSITPTAYYDLLTDTRGKFWIAHNRGISVYDPADSGVRTISTPRLQYDVQGYQLSNHDIIYINDNQLYVFREEIPENRISPPVRLTRLLVSDKNQVLRTLPGNPDAYERISLPFRRNTLGIEFAALNFLSPEENRYRFFMKGVDRDTVEAKQGTVAEYRASIRVITHSGLTDLIMTGSGILTALRSASASFAPGTGPSQRMFFHFFRRYGHCCVCKVQNGQPEKGKSKAGSSGVGPYSRARIEEQAACRN